MARPCSVARCPYPASYRGRCVLHARIYERALRPQPQDRGYSWAWRTKISKRFLALYPDCVVCGRPATQTDHIISIRDGGTHELSNLRGVCAGCHSRRTISDCPPRKEF
jgi:5-methylcytosine-specific restriction protein A